MKALFLMLMSFSMMASEGDAFTVRLYQYKDMNKELSSEVNRRLLKAVEKAFLRPVVGVMEFWSSHTNKLEGHYVKYENSIYRNLKLSENFPVHLGKLGMATFF